MSHIARRRARRKITGGKYPLYFRDNRYDPYARFRIADGRKKQRDRLVKKLNVLSEKEISNATPS